MPLSSVTGFLHRLGALFAAALIVLASATAARAQEPATDLFSPARTAALAAQVTDQRPRPAAVVHVDRNSDDPRFHFIQGAFLTAAGTDIAVTMYQMGRGSAREAGFGRWWQDSPVAFAATKSAMTAVFAYQLNRLHKTRPKAAFVLGIIETSVEAMMVARGATLSSPGQ